MKLNRNIVLAGTALSTLFAGTAALAQSTGTQEVEQAVIVKGKINRSSGGLAVDQTVTKTRSSITEDFLATQSPGSPLEAVNLLPGVNFSDQDATGAVGMDITLRGFDSQRVAYMLDGMPLNDTGSYAIYPTSNLDTEMYSRIDVNLGSTDVDSPTAAAGGGTINYTTRKPNKDMGWEVKESIGSNDYHREFVRFDTGAFGPWGTTAFFAASNLNSNKWKGPGSIDRKQINGRVYQPLNDGDFLSVAFTYNESRNNSYYDVSQSEYDSNYSLDYSPTISSTLSTAYGSTSNAYYGWKINPTNNGNIRAQSKFHLNDHLILTVDPSYQYTLANGGGVYTLTESSGVVSQTSGIAFGEMKGVDANHNGVIDTVAYPIYFPSQTRTDRYTLNSSLIWLINDNQTLRFAYTYDYGHHRQTGGASLLEDNKYIADPFSLDSAYYVLDKNGNRLEKRNRLSLAKLSQFVITYGGNFLDGKLHVDAGVRMPDFERDLTNYCYQTSASAAACTTNPVQTPGQSTTTFNNNLNSYNAPTSWKVHYKKALPNLGVSYNLGAGSSIYASYSEMMSAPRTDQLYDKKTPDLHPEMSQSWDLGYRFSSPKLMASASIWNSNFQHRIETGWDFDANASIATDVGNARMNGANGEIGYKPIKGLSLYASASYTHTEMLNNYYYSATAFDPTLGKQLGKIPRLMYAFSANYEIGQWQMGLQGKYTGLRYASLANSDNAPAFTVWNANVSYKLNKFGVLKDSSLRLNVKNLFNAKYKSLIYTGNAFFDSGNYYYPGQPISAFLTLDAKF